MIGKILFSVFCLTLFGRMQAQTTIANTAFTGTVIGTYSSTLSQCQFWCQNQYVAGCVAYTFDSSSSVCQFFSSVSSSGSSTTQTSGYVTSATTTTASTTTVVAGTVLSNTAYTGNVIGTFSTTQAQCSYYCQTQYVAGCIGWTFNPATGVCQFFSTITGSTNSTGVVSALIPATTAAATTTTASTTATTTTTTSTSTTTTKAALGTTTTASAVLGTTTVPATTPKTYFCAATNGINYPINDLTQVAAANASDCCTQCGINPSCFAFAYQIPYNTCYLKTATPAPGAAYVNDSSIVFGNLLSH